MPRKLCRISNGPPTRAHWELRRPRRDNCPRQLQTCRRHYRHIPTIRTFSTILVGQAACSRNKRSTPCSPHILIPHGPIKRWRKIISYYDGCRTPKRNTTTLCGYVRDCPKLTLPWAKSMRARFNGRKRKKNFVFK